MTDDAMDARAGTIEAAATTWNHTAELIAVENPGEAPAVVVGGVVVMASLEVDDRDDDAGDEAVRPGLQIVVDTSGLDPNLIALLNGQPLPVTLLVRKGHPVALTTSGSVARHV
jgi:hypothetical protein